MKLVQIIIIMLLSSGLIFSLLVQTDVVNNDKLSLSTPEKLRYLNIPERLKNAIEATEFVRQVADLNAGDRENAILREIGSGNVPSFARVLKPVKVIETIDGKSYELIFFSTTDYMAIGSDKDYIYVPLTPLTAQRIANSLDCLLPTKKIVDIIYATAEIKLRPQPIPPSEKMTTIPIFWQHTDSVKQQLKKIGFNRLTDEIIAGHKKDIIISNKIYDRNRTSDRVIIYGWHKAENIPIQPIYDGHIASYADYSHGVRFLSNLGFLNGVPIKLEAILKDSTYSLLLSNEGRISKPYYPIK